MVDDRDLLPDLRGADNPHLLVVGRHALPLAFLAAEHYRLRHGYAGLAVCAQTPPDQTGHPSADLRACQIAIGGRNPEEGLAFVWELLQPRLGDDRERRLALRRCLDEVLDVFHGQSQVAGRWLAMHFSDALAAARWEHVLEQLVASALEEQHPLPQVVDAEGGVVVELLVARRALADGAKPERFRQLRVFVPDPQLGEWYAGLGLEPMSDRLWFRTLGNSIAAELAQQEEFAAADRAAVLDYAMELAQQRPWEAAFLHATSGMVSPEDAARPLATTTIVSALRSAGFSDEADLLESVTAGEEPCPGWRSEIPAPVVVCTGQGEAIGMRLALALLAWREAAQEETALPKMLIIDGRLCRWEIVVDQVAQLLRLGRKYGLFICLTGERRADLATLEPLADLVFTTGEAIHDYDPSVTVAEAGDCHCHHMLAERSEALLAGIDRNRLQFYQQHFA